MSITQLTGGSRRGEATVTIGNVVIEGAVYSQQSGGWEAPEEVVDRGMDVSFFVNTQPVSVQIEAWVSIDTYEQLEQLRENGEPFGASVGSIGLPEAKLDDLVIEQYGEQPQADFGSGVTDAVEVQIDISQIRFARSETMSVEVRTEEGFVSSSVLALPQRKVMVESEDDFSDWSTDSEDDVREEIGEETNRGPSESPLLGSAR